MSKVRKCPRCGLRHRRPAAGEVLVALAEKLRHPIGVLVLAESEPGDPIGTAEFARVKLALDFVGRGPGFVFRALAEGWSRRRIIRELY